jgi:hypothetical protein
MLLFKELKLMKNLVFVIALLIGTSLVAETATDHGPSVPQSTPSTLIAPPTSVDKNGKLFQYINACMATRPSTNDDAVKKLFQ